MKTNLTRALSAAVLLAPTVALAHPGDHETMTVAQVAHHIATSPDHLAELAMLGLFMIGAAVRVRRMAR